MEIHFEITNECPLKCMHCSSWSLRYASSIGYGIENIANLLSLFNEPIDVFYTGGEPLLSDKLLDIVKQTNFLSNVNDVGLFSTGQILHRDRPKSVPLQMCYDLSNSGLTNAYISIYDSNFRNHDFITQSNGSFNNTIVSIKRLIKSGISVKLNVVVYKRNLHSLSKIVELGNKLGVSEIRFLKLINHGNALNNWETLSIGNQNFINEINNIKNSKCSLTVSGFPESFPCRPYTYAIGCQAGCKLLYVDYLGNVYPCASVKNNPMFLIGNVKRVDSILEQIKKYDIIRTNCLSGENYEFD